MKWILPILVVGTTVLPPSTDGTKPWKRHTIDASDPDLGKKGADSVRISDLNRDGRPDIVTAWEDGDTIRVCLNPGKDKAKALWPSVSVGRVKGATDAIFADLDGDARVDVISACEGTTETVFVHWAPASPQEFLISKEWKTEAIPCTEKMSDWMCLLAFDVDRDGDTDLITGSKGEHGAVGWLINPGHNRARDLKRWKWEKLATASSIMSIRDLDIDGDGHREITYSDRKGAKSGVYTMSHLNREPWIAAPVLLGFAGREVRFIDLADLNGDGKLDIAAAIAPNDFGFLFQPPSLPFRTDWKEVSGSPIDNRSAFGESNSVRIVDLDGDGKLSVVATCEHAGGGLSGAFRFPFQTAADQSVSAIDISGSKGAKFDRIELIDLDNDGDLDLLTCEESDGLGVFWYENPGKQRITE